MRNPGRIEKILDLIKVLWKYYPDQRFLQLLDNYILKYVQGDIFFVEDTDIEKWLRQEIKQIDDWKNNNKNYVSVPIIIENSTPIVDVKNKDVLNKEVNAKYYQKIEVTGE